MKELAKRIENEMKLLTTSQKLHKHGVRGDGGFTNYYAVPEGATQLSDLIYHKNMNHSLGEAFCAIYRMNDNGEKIRNIKKVIRYMELELQEAEKE